MGTDTGLAIPQAVDQKKPYQVIDGCWRDGERLVIPVRWIEALARTGSAAMISTLVEAAAISTAWEQFTFHDLCRFDDCSPEQRYVAFIELIGLGYIEAVQS